MLKTCTILAFFICNAILYGQQPQVVPDSKGNPQKPLNVDSFSYPNFLNGERHASFLVDYDISRALRVELQGFYDTYLLGDVFKVSIAPKWYVTKRMYFFSGVEMEKDLEKYGNEPAAPRLDLMNGVGYDVDDNFTIEARHDLQFNKTGYGEFTTPVMFSVGGKYKF
ncbi:hypothetical protein [Kriegella aquimaris]|uniref:Outer membrane protein beta-barrel domain-containing protein n=1 Tax=Kriegella aquimaris TaxID=192904 RepID=A0A1G9WA89_9FLAO|nr:hypothetical protein [Kriegella aquimaris]SDM81478.1 hypothetical protein SAMN04488514_11526 [Kriegella aquimaris]